jgi:photosystem II stability/assembly factor-like uncharacterized protein
VLFWGLEKSVEPGRIAHSHRLPFARAKRILTRRYRGGSAMKFHEFRRASYVILGTFAWGCAHAGTWVDPTDAPAEIMPLAAHTLLLDLARAGERYVAVGARGDVLISHDGREWRQAQVPTRATFTAVTAIDAQIWAVGHDGVIAHSADGGEHWKLQRQDAWKPPAEGSDALHDSRQGVPLLGVLFTDAQHGYAVGAYSLALRTADGGETWQPMTVAAPPKEEAAPAKPAAGGGDESWTMSKSERTIGQEATPHLNAIARTGSGALFIVGERGSAFRSRDAGTTWQRLQLPYDGSMFGVIGYAGDHLIAFGLRGHVFESNDLGEHWNALETGTELSLMGGTALPDDGAAIVGANGIILTRAKSGQPLTNQVDQPAGTLAAVLPLAGGNSLLVAGENGVSVYQPQ